MRVPYRVSRAADITLGILASLERGSRKEIRSTASHPATVRRNVKVRSEIVRITHDQFETSDGKTHGIGDAETLLPRQRWNEYRKILGTLHMREAMFRRTGTGEVYVAAQTFGVGPFRSYYGYLYCPRISAIPSVYVPCMEGRDSADRNAYGYKALGSNWYFYKVFTLYEIE